APRSRMSCNWTSVARVCRNLLARFGERQFRPKQAQHNSLLGVVHQSEDAGAAFAEPEMLNVVKVLRRVRRRAIRDLIFFARTEAQEFAAGKPMESGGARRVCALRIKLVEQRSTLEFGAVGWG